MGGYDRLHDFGEEELDKLLTRSICGECDCGGDDSCTEGKPGKAKVCPGYEMQLLVYDQIAREGIRYMKELMRLWRFHA